MEDVCQIKIKAKRLIILSGGLTLPHLFDESLRQVFNAGTHDNEYIC